MSNLAERLEAAARAIPQNQEVAAGADDTTEDTGLDLVDMLPEGPDDGEIDDDSPGEDTGGSEGDDVDAEEESPIQAKTSAQTKPETLSRMVRNMAVKERELAQEREARRAEQAELRRLREEVEALRGSPMSASEEDAVDVLRSHLMRQVGTKDPRDPRVVEALREAVQDATIEAFPDGSNSVEALRQRGEARAKRQAERSKFKEYDDRIAAMERDRLRFQQEAQTAQLRSTAQTFLVSNADATPYLTAAVEIGDIGDPAATVVDIAAAGVADGTFRDPQTMEELGQLYALITNNLETHYRGLAEGLTRGRTPKSAAPAGKSAAPLAKNGNTRQQTRVPAVQAGGSGAGKKARNTTGGGGRGSAPKVQTDATDDGPGDLAQRIARAERAARRGR